MTDKINPEGDLLDVVKGCIETFNNTVAKKMEFDFDGGTIKIYIVNNLHGGKITRIDINTNI